MRAADDGAAVLFAHCCCLLVEYSRGQDIVFGTFCSDFRYLNSMYVDIFETSTRISFF
ncbi:conserved exported hypothetical protein [Azoarcus sp. CIB]|nr:conserved exported hypothetical protein [Azoarcus sp. CIB]